VFRPGFAPHGLLGLFWFAAGADHFPAASYDVEESEDNKKPAEFVVRLDQGEPGLLISAEE